MGFLPLGRYAEPTMPPANAEAVSVVFAGDTFTVFIRDGRRLVLPISWCPALAGATPEQRANYSFVGDGVAVYWPDIQEELSVRRLLVPDGDPYFTPPKKKRQRR